MTVRADCRHYVMQTVRSGERVENCRLDAGEKVPFGCPPDCLFHEPRSTSTAGWQQPTDPRPDGERHPGG